MQFPFGSIVGVGGGGVGDVGGVIVGDVGGGAVVVTVTWLHVLKLGEQRASSIGAPSKVSSHSLALSEFVHTGVGHTSAMAKRQHVVRRTGGLT
jgi:hypothetical protein